MPFPDLVSTTAFPFSAPSRPYVAPNTALYVVLQDSFLQVWKSLDNGLTWFQMDAAHVPATIGSVFSSTFHGTKLYVVSLIGASKFQISVFDTATDLWGTTTLTTNSWATSEFFQVFYRASDDNLIISTNKAPIGGIWRTGYFTFDTVGLTFSAITPTGETGASPLYWEPFAILESTGGVQLMFISRDIAGFGGETRTIWRQPLSDLNVLGSLVSVDSISDAGSSNTCSPAAFCDGITATVIWVPTDSSPLQAKVLKAPISTFTFTSQLINAPGGDIEIDNVAIVNSATAGVVAFMTTQVGNCYTAKDSGSGFGSVSLVGALPSYASNTNIFWANLLADPIWGLIFNNFGSPETDFWTGGGSEPSQLTLACPVNTTVLLGVPYSGQLIAGGAEGPFTFTKTAGAFPAGLALDSATGIISGTPTAGGEYSYTVEVTDEAGDTPADATCGVSVEVDPDPPGAWELMRVTCTMRPARHLPVRGSAT